MPENLKLVTGEVCALFSMKKKCKQCGLCFPVCPEDSIPVDKETLKRKDFNFDYCKGCGVCAKVCPFGAITMKEEGV